MNTSFQRVLPFESTVIDCGQEVLDWLPCAFTKMLAVIPSTIPRLFPVHFRNRFSWEPTLEKCVIDEDPSVVTHDYIYIVNCWTEPGPIQDNSTIYRRLTVTWMTYCHRINAPSIITALAFQLGLPAAFVGGILRADDNVTEQEMLVISVQLAQIVPRGIYVCDCTKHLVMHFKRATLTCHELRHGLTLAKYDQQAIKILLTPQHYFPLFLDNTRHLVLGRSDKGGPNYPICKSYTEQRESDAYRKKAWKVIIFSYLKLVQNRNSILRTLKSHAMK